MDQKEFETLLDRFTRAAEAGDGAAFAACFTEDAIYHDYIYGDHVGRKEIAHMMTHLFHGDAGPDYRWEMFDPVVQGDLAYARSLSSFTSTRKEFEGRRVVIEGMSKFRLRDGLICDYAESVNGGIGMAQLGVAPERMAKVFRKWTGWMEARADTQEYLAREKGTRRK
jgi:uncharacterized protein (TIGR02246 family)